jgi:hypothetical protein
MFAAFAGLAAGLIHVLSGPDHLAAVAPLAADRVASRWRAGLQWGLGHTAGVLAVGLLLISFRGFLPIEDISAYSERLVGLALLGVGVWGLVQARHPRPHVHATGRASFAMGALHGLAGSSHLFGVLPALALPTNTAALAYLGGFGVGAVLAMTAFAAAIGALAVRATTFGGAASRSVLYACSLGAMVVGGLWLVA